MRKKEKFPLFWAQNAAYASLQLVSFAIPTRGTAFTLLIVISYNHSVDKNNSPGNIGIA